MIDFKNKNVAVLGLGIEGESSARFLRKQGAKVTELDQKKDKNYLKNLDSFDIIVRTPGIKRDLPEILAAEQKGVVITSHIKIFFDLCPAKIIGVTGTKGKGTTSALIYEMLKKEGFNAYLGGNIGNPPLDFLDKLTPQPASPRGESWVVLELSSFQLQDATKSPHIAVVLMITQEHLAQDKGIGSHENYHTDILDYINAKRNILRFQIQSDFAVINRDYPASHESDIHTQAKVFQVSRERVVANQGCFVKDKKEIWIKKDDREYKIIDTKDIFIPGEHNWENAAAAAMAATLAGVLRENIKYVLHTFKGLDHRLELVSEVNGVRYYDDSFSTIPETAIAAIKAFKAPEIVILGGAHKGSDFTELGRVISTAKNIKAIIGIGLEWPKIKERIRNYELGIMVVEDAKNMTQIVQAAAKTAKPGDVVLLTPACSSFDMFKNYKDRGEQFKQQVLLLSS